MDKGGAWSGGAWVRELEEASNDFREDNRLGDGASDVVYRGIIDNRQATIKRLRIDETRFVESKWQFDAEVLTIRRAKHPNIVGFIGFCAEGNRRLVVYEDMALGSMDNLLMKIDVGAAKGLAYFHSQMTPPMIFRDMKSANILLGEGYKPKLSGFGNAIDGPLGDQTYITTRDAMGTRGYIASKYQ
ncbi:putative serine/threonine-protein kinase PBL5 [Bienertia sinuspersici]